MKKLTSLAENVGELLIERGMLAEGVGLEGINLVEAISLVHVEDKF